MVIMVLHFSSDPMHLVDEGVEKKLFLTLLKDSEFKVSPFFCRRINEDMDNLSSIPHQTLLVAHEQFHQNLKLRNGRSW